MKALWQALVFLWNPTTESERSLASRFAFEEELLREWRLNRWINRHGPPIFREDPDLQTR